MPLYFAKNGMVGVNATYRLAPAAQWPAAAEDVKALAVPVLAHRVLLSAEAEVRDDLHKVNKDLPPQVGVVLGYAAPPEHAYAQTLAAQLVGARPVNPPTDCSGCHR